MEERKDERKGRKEKRSGRPTCEVERGSEKGGKEGRDERKETRGGERKGGEGRIVSLTSPSLCLPHPPTRNSLPGSAAAAGQQSRKFNSGVRKAVEDLLLLLL